MLLHLGNQSSTIVALHKPTPADHYTKGSQDYYSSQKESEMTLGAIGFNVNFWQ